MKQENNLKTHPRLIPVSKWNEYHEWPSQSALRALIYHKNENGFRKVVKNPCGRLLIDENAFFEWVDSNNEYRN